RRHRPWEARRSACRLYLNALFRRLFPWWRQRLRPRVRVRDELERKLIVLPVEQHAYRTAVPKLPEQDLVGQWLLQMVLDDASKRSRAKMIVIGLRTEPPRRLGS